MHKKGRWDEQYARRIAACLNGCAGIANPAAVRDVLEACQYFVDSFAGNKVTQLGNGKARRAYDLAHAAVAKATATETKSAQGV